MKFIVPFLVLAIFFGRSNALSTVLECQCTPPNPLCSWDDCLPSVAGMSGVMDVPIANGSDTCLVTVFWCSRNLTGTACAKAGYGSSCEYKIQKVCYPLECAVACGTEEMNAVLQGLVESIALVNPAGHFVPTSNQWYDNSYKTAWRLGFPACVACEADSSTGCVSIVACGASTCYEWNEAYQCLPPNCPSLIPPCAAPCPGPAVTLNKLDQGKTVGECTGPGQNCRLCGY